MNLRPFLILSAACLSAATSVSAAPVKTDYAGHPFVTQPAPRLTFERRLTPHLRGIDYPFAPQTARGVALFDRFPPFSLSDRRIFMSGPWYDSLAANSHFLHGITAVEAMPNFRQGIGDIRQVAPGHKWMLLTDPTWRIHATILADRLAAANPNDERIPALRAFANDHVFTVNEAAYRELGRDLWRGERVPIDATSKGFAYAMIDIEQTGGWEHQRDCEGWLYQGLIEEAAKDGIHLVPITYGQWTFSVGTVWESMRQGGTGEPEYLLPEKDFVAAPDPTLQALEDHQGVLSMDGYMQAIWGDEPFYKRNPDGSLLLKEGHPVFNDISQTTLYGQTVGLEPGEAEHCLQDIYRQAARMVLMYYRRAGEYPASSDQSKPFVKNVRIGAWSRITNEGLQGINQNDRPLPGWLMEMLAQMYLFTADDFVVWSSDTNIPPPPLGNDNSKAWKYNAHGVFEYIIKGAHRYSALDALHAGSTGPFQWCWFHLPMVDKNQSDGERPDQKPLVFGKIRTFEGKPWLELFATWPSLDNAPANFQVWIDQNGRRSPAYTIQLANGRSTFYDAWQLPASFKGLQGKDVYLRFRDLTGQTRTWRGDWRAAVPGG